MASKHERRVRTSCTLRREKEYLYEELGGISITGIDQYQRLPSILQNVLQQFRLANFSPETTYSIKKHQRWKFKDKVHAALNDLAYFEDFPDVTIILRSQMRPLFHTEREQCQEFTIYHEDAVNHIGASSPKRFKNNKSITSNICKYLTEASSTVQCEQNRSQSLRKGDKKVRREGKRDSKTFIKVFIDIETTMTSSYCNYNHVKLVNEKKTFMNEKPISRQKRLEQLILPESCWDSYKYTKSYKKFTLPRPREMRVTEREKIEIPIIDLIIKDLMKQEVQHVRKQKRREGHTWNYAGEIYDKIRSKHSPLLTQFREMNLTPHDTYSKLTKYRKGKRKAKSRNVFVFDMEEFPPIAEMEQDEPAEMKTRVIFKRTFSSLFKSTDLAVQLDEGDLTQSRFPHISSDKKVQTLRDSQKTPGIKSQGKHRGPRLHIEKAKDLKTTLSNEDLVPFRPSKLAPLHSRPLPPLKENFDFTITNSFVRNSDDGQTPEKSLPKSKKPVGKRVTGHVSLPPLIVRKSIPTHFLSLDIESCENQTHRKTNVNNNQFNRGKLSFVQSINKSEHHKSPQWKF